MHPRILSLFSGYGGLDMAVQEVFGGDLVAVADIDSGPCKILAHRHPGVPNLGDVSTIDNLWVMMREGIAQLRPRYVIWENVRGAYSASAASAMESDPRLLGDHPAGQPALRALGRVLGDLADLGYDAQWCGLPAADVGAPHGRFRVFLLATRRDAADSDQPGLEGQQGQAGAAQAGRHGHALAGAVGPDLTLLPTPRATDGTKGGPNQRGSSGDLMLPSAVTQLLPTPSVADTTGGRKRRSGSRNGELLLNGIAHHQQWGKYAGAIARWEAIHGPAPAPTMTSPRSGNQQLSPAFTEWMMGLPAGWITDVPGITRNEALKACCNGVVPAQAAAALRFMLTRQEVVT